MTDTINQPTKQKKRLVMTSLKTGTGKKIYIPPRRKVNFKQSITLSFIIPGIIPSKKNCQVPSINKNRIEAILKREIGRPVTTDLIDRVLAIKPFIRNSNRYLQWEEKAKQDLILQAAEWKTKYQRHGLAFPISKASISIYHYWADVKSRDNSNKAESIHDTLVACGILADDDYHCLYKNSAEADVYKGEILKHTTVVYLTAHEW